MASLIADSTRRSGAPPHSPDGEQFLQPVASRILASAGFAELPHATRHHSSIARRIVLGRQVMRIVAKGHAPQ
jgi:hypothetical protein